MRLLESGRGRLDLLRSFRALSLDKLIKLYPLLNLLGLFISFLDLITQKTNRIVICGSNGGKFASGSPKVLANYIEKNVSDLEVHYYLPFKEALNGMARIRYIIKFAPLFFRAKFLISSHPPNDFFPFSYWSRRKIMINLWHGIPLKSMFFADKNASKTVLKFLAKLNKRTNAFIVSSKLEEALLSKCFLINSSKFLRAGHPRNVGLVKKTRCGVIEKLDGLPRYKKVILYCPTYRRREQTQLFPFYDMDLDNLKKLLNDMNAVMLIRKHYYEQNRDAKLLCDRIRLFGFDVCDDINSALPEVDVLITDYSSVYFDFLILDRPMIFIPYDLQEFEENTGILFDDYFYWTPGPKVCSYSDFRTALYDSIVGSDSFTTRRKELAKIFHSFEDGESCKRIVNYIRDKISVNK